MTVFQILKNVLSPRSLISGLRCPYPCLAERRGQFDEVNPVYINLAGGG
jgi:hypothetical protein